MLPTKEEHSSDRNRAALVAALFCCITVVTAIMGSMRPVSAQSTAPRWSYTGKLNQARSFASATTLQDGRVLIAGGNGSYDDYVPLNSAELYNPTTGTWTMTGSLVSASGFVNLTLHFVTFVYMCCW